MAEPQNAPDVVSLAAKGIASACVQLQAAEKLLLDPHPRAIAQAGFVLQQALTLTATCAGASVATEDLARFRECCTRVRTLLEGALRVQWAYIHRMDSATSTYTVGPITKRWNPRVCTLDLKA